MKIAEVHKLGLKSDYPPLEEISARMDGRKRMAKVTGIGGVFFKSRDPQALRGWYRDRLGIDVQSWGGVQFFFNLSSGSRVTTTLPR